MRQAESFCNRAGGEYPLVVDSKYRIERESLVQGDELVRGDLRPVEIYDLGSIPDHRLEGRSAIRGDDKIQVEGARSGNEIRCPVGRTGYQEYDAAHGSYDGPGGVE
jgi:hypothetical protein